MKQFYTILLAYELHKEKMSVYTWVKLNYNRPRTYLIGSINQLAGEILNMWHSGNLTHVLPYWWMLCKRDKEHVDDQAGECSILNRSSWQIPPAENTHCTSLGPIWMSVRPMNMPQSHLDHHLLCPALWVQTVDGQPELTWTNKWQLFLPVCLVSTIILFELLTCILLNETPWLIGTA